MAPSLPTPARRLALAQDNVWAWVDGVAETCTKTPLTKMGSGFLEFNPPDFLIDAHQQALKDIDTNQYGPLFGRTNFRTAVADEYSKVLKRPIDPKAEISICSGASEGMLSVLLGYIEAGDEVIVMEPCFNLYLYLIQWAGGTPKTVSMKPPSMGSSSAASDWVLDPLDLEKAITPKTKMIMVNTPHNPLGKVFTEQELHQIASICVKHNVLILSDEVYERIHYTPTFPRLATLHPDYARITLTVLSVGKAFNATGWRLGFVLGAPDVLLPAQLAHVFQTYVTAGPVQEAAARGYAIARDTDFWETNKVFMKEKVDSFCAVLDEIGLPYVKPEAAFFFFVDVSTVEIPVAYREMPQAAGKPHDYQACWFLMQEFGVITIPGSAFYLDQDAPQAHTHLRFTVCKTDDEILRVKERLRGLEKFVKAP